MIKFQNMIPETLKIVDPPDGFTCQFDGVFSIIPQTFRDTLVEFWGEVRRNGEPFQNSIASRDDGAEEGCTCPRGRKIVFQRRVWRDKDPQYITELIAHELAHVYDWCAGPARNIEGLGKDALPEEDLKMERRAVEIAHEWGFNLPGDKRPEVHYKEYADRILKLLPPSIFPPTDASVVYLRAVSSTGDVPLSQSERMQM